MSETYSTGTIPQISNPTRVIVVKILEALNNGGSGGGAVSQIVAGTNITVSPSGGTGAVTVNSTGGGSQEIFSGNYAGTTPPFTPSVAQAIAIDTSSGRQWQWYSASWN